MEFELNATQRVLEFAARDPLDPLSSTLRLPCLRKRTRNSAGRGDGHGLGYVTARVSIDPKDWTNITAAPNRGAGHPGQPSRAGRAYRAAARWRRQSKLRRCSTSRHHRQSPAQDFRFVTMHEIAGQKGRNNAVIPFGRASCHRARASTWIGVRALSWILVWLPLWR